MLSRLNTVTLLLSGSPPCCHFSFKYFIWQLVRRAELHPWHGVFRAASGLWDEKTEEWNLMYFLCTRPALLSELSRQQDLPSASEVEAMCSDCVRLCVWIWVNLMWDLKVHAENQEVHLGVRQTKRRLMRRMGKRTPAGPVPAEVERSGSLVPALLLVNLEKAGDEGVTQPCFHGEGKTGTRYGFYRTSSCAAPPPHVSSQISFPTTKISNPNRLFCPRFFLVLLTKWITTIMCSTLLQ